MRDTGAALADLLDWLPTRSLEGWQESPVRPIFESGAVEGRIRIRAGSGSDQYPMLVQAAAEGGTDYFLQLTPPCRHIGDLVTVN
ncbi:MAG: hypothetical protein WB783_01720 [Arenicellales bacterium]